MPFELWMRRIAELSESEMSSGRFLTSAMNEVATLPWILGAHWSSDDLIEGGGEFGRNSPHAATFHYHSLEVTFYTESDLSPAMFLHVRLLAQVIGEFHEGKRREQAMKQNAYMQAVHETGARLTHDIKNLLQSIVALTSASAVARARAQDSAATSASQGAPQALSSFEQMLERQLPQLSQRLQTTLDKLRNPAIAGAHVIVPAVQWWREIRQRHQTSRVLFVGDEDILGNVVANVYDAVLENCIENARKKREREPSISLMVELVAGDTPTLFIADTGSAIPERVLESLLSAPVLGARTSGLGIGLYQAARQAEEAGFRFSLASNVKGHVRFKLEKLSTTQDTPPFT